MAGRAALEVPVGILLTTRFVDTLYRHQQTEMSQSQERIAATDVTCQLAQLSVRKIMSA